MILTRHTRTQEVNHMNYREGRERERANSLKWQSAFLDKICWGEECRRLRLLTAPNTWKQLLVTLLQKITGHFYSRDHPYSMFLMEQWFSCKLLVSFHSAAPEKVLVTCPSQSERRGGEGSDRSHKPYMCWSSQEERERAKNTHLLAHTWH